MEKLSKNKLRLLLSFTKKKARDEQNLFLAEGNKLVRDLLPYFHCKTIVGTVDFFEKEEIRLESDCYIATKEELERLSLTRSPQSVWALFERKEHNLNLSELKEKLSLALDGVQDPGNLGTIIRIADWFGIENIICSSNCVDLYNPKVVQATMGAIARVKIHYTDLVKLMDSVGDLPIYGTFLEGDIIYETPLSSNGIIVMGNEGNGISEEVKQRITQKLFIPNYPSNRKTSESLNVAVATSIVCSEFRRR
ncbi:MAG: RNA methyltransferase [Paludibacteraceae bacterium]|nr:RNA methyltransferase [Paludibacteraceae bacterium]